MCASPTGAPCQVWKCSCLTCGIRLTWMLQKFSLFTLNWNCLKASTNGMLSMSPTVPPSCRHTWRKIMWELLTQDRKFFIYYHIVFKHCGFVNMQLASKQFLLRILFINCNTLNGPAYSIQSIEIGARWLCCVTKFASFYRPSNSAHPFLTQGPGRTFPHRHMHQLGLSQ